MTETYFTDTKYTNTYYRIINKAKNRERPGGYIEKHHVIPKAISKNSEIVALTAKEHYVCHLLLLKMVHVRKHRRAMAYALIQFRRNHSKVGKRFTGALYSLLREKIVPLFSGKNNPFYGKGHLVTGENNHFYGKRHSEFIKKQMGRNHKSTTGTENGFYGRTHSKETKLQLSNMRRGSKQKSGPYKLTSPLGEIYIVTEGIYAFCREHGLCASNVIQSVKNGHKSRNWTVETYETT